MHRLLLTSPRGLPRRRPTTIPGNRKPGANPAADGGSGRSDRSPADRLPGPPSHPQFMGLVEGRRMISVLPRLTRMSMLCLLLAFAAARPAAAQSVLRDRETEHLFKDASAPLI